MSLHSRLAGHAAQFRAALDDAQGVQARRLRMILARNAQCEYGRTHGFAAIADPAEYARRVPVVRYDELHRPIDRMAGGEQRVLVADPVVAFEETGGSSGGAKLVPYTEAALAAFQRGLLPWLDDLYSRVPALDAGRAYWSISPAARAPRRTEGGIPVGLGSDAAYLGEAVAQEVLATLCVPPHAALLHDIDAWRRFTLVHLLAAADLALVSIWSPTFLQALLRHAQQDVDALADCVARGHVGVDAKAAGVELPAPPADVARRTRARDPRRARARLDPPVAAAGRRELLGPGGRPAVRGCVAWCVSRCARAGQGAAGNRRAGHDSVWRRFHAGAGRRFRLLRVRRCPRSRASRGRRRAGRRIRTAADQRLGLRYAIGDRVRVHAFAGGAPTLEFMGRAGIASDLCGEKLTEAFVSAALRGLALRFAMLAPSEASPRGYVLLLDAAEVDATSAVRLAAGADAALAVNPQYAYARELGQLPPVRAVRCAHPVERWLDLCRQRGQRLGDVKPAALCTVAGWQAQFPPVA